MAFAGERFSSETTLSAEAVAAHALMAGDTNPVHHDREYAKSTRFGRPIASGTHTTALLLGLTAKHFSEQAAMLGLEFWVRFRRAIFVDETIKIEWLVVRVARNERLGGDVVDLRGRIKGQDGLTAVGAKGRVLVTSAL
jgi:acyl dehydratase